MFCPKPTEPRSRFLAHGCKLALIAIFVLISIHGRTQELSKRLILKDGSYQLVTKYEVNGDRVRYLSAERNEWEELPKDLIDWPATEKFEKERSVSALPEAATIDKETDAERNAELARLPLVAPGLRLPEESGVFLLDNYQSQAQLVELQQLEGAVDEKARPNILRGALAPMGGKQSIELEGEHATVKAHVNLPSIYINVEDDLNQPPPGQTASAQPSRPSLDAPREQPQQAEGPLVPSDRFRIVRAKVKNGRRGIGDLKRNSSGKISENADFVKTTIDKIGHGWFKLTPAAELAPGEYALIEMNGNEAMNLYVWDFGINPNAGPNANPWKPEEKDTTKPVNEVK
jgi:hypothetical protein